MLIWKINASVWFRWMKKKTSSLIEDKRKDEAHMAHTRRNPKRHIPLVSLLLWRKMVTVRCFAWALGLRLWSVSETKFRVLTAFLKFYILPPVSVFLFLTLHLMLDGLILFRKGDFHCVRSF